MMIHIEIGRLAALARTRRYDIVTDRMQGACVRLAWGNKLVWRAGAEFD